MLLVLLAAFVGRSLHVWKGRKQAFAGVTFAVMVYYIYVVRSRSMSCCAVPCCAVCRWQQEEGCCGCWWCAEGQAQDPCS